MTENSIGPIDGTRTDTINTGQNGPRSNGNEEVLHTPKSFRTGV